eukprot:g3828.t1
MTFDFPDFLPPPPPFTNRHTRQYPSLQCELALSGRLQEIITELPSFKVKGRFFVDATSPSDRQKEVNATKARAREKRRMKPSSPQRRRVGRGNVRKNEKKGNIALQIAAVEAEMETAVQNLNFEVCVPLRAKLMQLKELSARNEGLLAKPDLEGVCETTKRGIMVCMEPLIAESNFEGCIPLRNDMQTLETLRKQYNATSSNDEAWKGIELRIRELETKYSMDLH